MQENRAMLRTFLAFRKFPKFSSEFDRSGKILKSGKFRSAPLIFPLPYAFGRKKEHESKVRLTNEDMRMIADSGGRGTNGERRRRFSEAQCRVYGTNKLGEHANIAMNTD